jgi:cobyrinic acid a,c-diamide synthase
VAPFKVGPDYIDPGYHSVATGAPGRNLDPVLVGEQRVAPLFVHGAQWADVAVVEGVMGLFDGRHGARGYGSTAHVAGLIDAPVVLVVDATGQGGSLAALLHGFRGYDPSVRLAGVVLNRVGSPRHEQVLRDACAEVGLPVFGALHRDPALHVPSRHLGLVTAAEHGSAATRAVGTIADAVGAALDLDVLLALAATAGPLATQPWDAGAEVREPMAVRPLAGEPNGRPVVAVARGAAFTFHYAEHVELLHACGAEVAVFDPLRDEALPEAAVGLVLPGGFPEQHAEDLSANTTLRAAVAALARAGGPVHAECGGLLYLGERLDGYPMCGVLDARATMSERLVLGYRDAVAATDSPLRRVGERTVGHEFHRTTVEPASGARPAWHWRDGQGLPVVEGYVHGGVHASYLHTHPAGSPESVARFVAACAGVPSRAGRLPAVAVK